MESATDLAGTSNSPRRRRNSSGFRAGWAALACSAALALSSCSAGQAESAEGGSADGGSGSSADSSSSPNSPVTSAPSTPATPAPTPTETAVEMSELIEPAPPPGKDNNPAGARLLLSEKGTGAGTHAVQGPVEPGEVLSILSSCSPGSAVTISLDNPLSGGELGCENPTGNRFTTEYATEAVGEITVTVETADGGPYWVVAWAHRKD